VCLNQKKQGGWGRHGGHALLKFSDFEIFFHQTAFNRHLQGKRVQTFLPAALIGSGGGKVTFAAWGGGGGAGRPVFRSQTIVQFPPKGAKKAGVQEVPLGPPPPPAHRPTNKIKGQPPQSCSFVFKYHLVP